MRAERRGGKGRCGMRRFVDWLLGRKRIDYSLKRGDRVWWPGTSFGTCEVVDVNWALRAVAINLRPPNGGIIIIPVSSVIRADECD